MNGEYDRLRQLLLDQERDRLDALQADLRESGERVPDRVADEIERGLASGRPTRLSRALAEATVSGLEQAVQRRPETVVNAVFPVIGPAIRRSIQEAMRQLSADIDRAVNNALSPRSLKWRVEAWRSGVPYAQVVLRHTASWRVEHLFLIQPESGLLLGHLTASGLPELDADAVAGMFTAIQQFVRDSVSGDDAHAINSATVGDYRLEVGEGPQARLVAFVRGVPPVDFPTRLDELIEALHARHGAALAEGTGVGAEGAGLLEQPQFDALNARDDATAAPQPQSQSNTSRYVLWGALAVVAGLLAWWAWASWSWSKQVAGIRRQLSSMPGVVVTQFDDSARGELRIEGLRDPAAADPQAWLSQAHPKIEARWKLRGFMSLEPELTAARAALALGLPKENVLPPDAQGVLKLRGEVPFATWYRLRHDPPGLAMAGVTGIDASALAYPQQARVEALGAQLKRLTIPFASGAGVPDADAEAALARIVAGVRGLQAAGGGDIAFGFRTAGLTDGAGSGEQNAELRRQRAEWLAGRLAAEVRAPSDVAVDQALAAADAAIGQRGARVVAVPMPAKREAAR
ncbi:hypothetical protein CSC71_06470 [Pseudoxanthomonas sangjuensis]|uniref:hypothetical protein n=1 Tax=Pseudoxanthomonas sangjuensis TaxID=1503750 RepID=UPI0013913CDE|nr:hypothetical protein [Pseudoxanthomonas sangjuensis]KAF1713711.1 hypothetical protein CSC71_06470 [Pseudoxanthomonas sangjuensis]